MKKILSAVFAICIFLFSTLCLASCGSSGDNDNTTAPADAGASVIDIDIKEATFKGWIKELNTNAEDYMGKTVRLEGVMYKYQADNGNTYNTVYRDGCCADDHMYFLEFIPSGIVTAVNGDWVEVVGTFSSYTEGTDEYITLKDAKVTVKTERGNAQIGL